MLLLLTSGDSRSVGGVGGIDGVVVVVVVYLKRLRIVLRCAKAGCGRRTSSS